MMRTPSSTSGAVGRGGVLATLAGRLTARDRWLLRMLHEHSVLTTTHLHQLGWASGLRQVQGRARVLRAHEVLDGFRPLRPYGHGSHPLHLVLGPVGAQVLAAEAGVTVAEIGYRGRARALSVAHRLTLAHDIGTTGLVSGLAAAPGTVLVRWWSARRCGRYFGHHARPDAYLTLTTTDTTIDTAADTTTATATGTGTGGIGAVGWWEMFLEYDTGSESLTQLTGKLAGYHNLAQDTGVVTPLGIWFTRPGREPSARRALADAVHALPVPGRVPILTGTPSPTSAPSRGAPAGSGPRSGRGAAPPVAPTEAGRRTWLALRPGVVERVDLAALARLHPRAPVPMLDQTEPDDPSGAQGADPAGRFPAPHPYPPGRPLSVEAPEDPALWGGWS